MIIDKTIIEIIVALIAGAGILSVMTKFYIRELNASFWGKNPFAQKRDIVDKVKTKIFIVLAFIGILIHVVSIIYNKRINESLYDEAIYWSIFIIGLILTYVLVRVLSLIGDYFARKQWVPLVIETHKNTLTDSKYILNHDFLRADQSKLIDQPKEKKEIYQKANLDSVKSRLELVEKLLEVTNSSDNLMDRINRLEEIFSSY